MGRGAPSRSRSAAHLLRGRLAWRAQRGSGPRRPAHGVCEQGSLQETEGTIRRVHTGRREASGTGKGATASPQPRGQTGSLTRA